MLTRMDTESAHNSTSYLDKAPELASTVPLFAIRTLSSSDGTDEKGRNFTDRRNKILIVLCTFAGTLFILFVLSTAVGVIRVYRYPELYGPRNSQDGSSSQTRVQGLARAVLDTFPVVKFTQRDASPTGSTDLEHETAEPRKDSAQTGASRQDYAETPTCSICAEDFAAEEDVRILPCKHEFHRHCIDPWLVQQSTKCPLWYVHEPCMICRSWRVVTNRVPLQPFRF